MSNPFGGGPPYPPGGPSGTPPPGGGGFGQPPGGGGFGQPPPGGGGFGPPPGGGGFGQPPPGGGFGTPPPGGGFGTPPPGGGQFGAPIAQPMTAVPFSNGPAMVLGIVVAGFCGCVPGGILGIYLADQAKKAAARGNLDEANSKLRMSYLVSGISMIVPLIGFCLYVALVVVANA